MSTGAIIYPVGSLYFKPVTVAGTFSTYVPVDTPVGRNRICNINEMHWVGYEVQNFTVGVRVDGYVTGGYLTLEFYNLDTCSLITTASLPLPRSGLYWTSVQPSLPPDAQIGLRVRVSGRAEVVTSIGVYVAVRYRKTVNDLAQVATSKATSWQPPPISASGRQKVAVLFGPYVAYDGLAAIITGATYSYIYVPPSAVRLLWFGSYCPWLTVEYYVNGVYYTIRFVGPSTSSPAGYYCYYNVPSTVLRIRARDYAVSKATSSGGGISVAVVYTAYSDITISYGGRLEIVYDRWVEPFHSRYIDPSEGLPYLHWNQLLLLNTFQVLGPVNNTVTTNMVTEVRASPGEIVLSLQHNDLTLCATSWRFAGLRVDGYALYYGDEVVEEPWWVATARRVAAIDWMLTLTEVARDRSPWWASFLLKTIQSIFLTSSGRVEISTSDGDVVITWRRG